MEIRTILHRLCTPVTFVGLRGPLLSPLRIKINKKNVEKLQRMGERDKAAEYSLMRITPF